MWPDASLRAVASRMPSALVSGKLLWLDAWAAQTVQVAQMRMMKSDILPLANK